MARQYFRPVFLICLSSLMGYALPSAAEYRCKKGGMTEFDAFWKKYCGQN